MNWKGTVFPSAAVKCVQWEAGKKKHKCLHFCSRKTQEKDRCRTEETKVHLRFVEEHLAAIISVNNVVQTFRPR